MENLNQTFETLKRVNASLHKLNNALMRDYSITVDECLTLKENLELMGTQHRSVVAELNKINQENDELREKLRRAEIRNKVISDIARCNGVAITDSVDGSVEIDGGDEYQIILNENLKLREKLSVEITNRDYWINQDKWNREQLEIQTQRKNANWENLKAANANFDKLAIECAKLRDRNIELEQMLGAISLQCERELVKKDETIKFLEESNHDNREYVNTLDRQYRNFLDQRDIELKLLTSIIKGEI